MIEKIANLVRQALLFGMLSLVGCSTLSPNMEIQGSTLVIQSVPDTFSISTSGIWAGIKNRIATAKQKTIVIHWSGRGGRMDQGQSFMQVVERAKSQGKEVIFIIDGYSASMHALAPCSGSRVVNNSTMMFHRAEVRGVMPMDQESDNEIRHFMSYCVKHGIINQNDIESVIRANVLYVNKGFKRTEADDRPRG